MERKIAVGLYNSIETQVSKRMLAVNVGSGDANVLATPALVNIVESLCFNMIDKGLEDKELTSVGVGINIKHLHPTPLGMRILAKSTIIGIDRKMITFRIDLYDEKENIGYCIHERAIVNRKKFINKVDSKKHKIKNR